MERESGNDDDSLLIVPVPADDSKPSSPNEADLADWPPWSDDADGDEMEGIQSGVDSSQTTRIADVDKPRLPKRRPPHRVLSNSPEEDGPALPSWLAAQEEEARTKNNFIEEDIGV